MPALFTEVLLVSSPPSPPKVGMLILAMTLFNLKFNSKGVCQLFYNKLPKKGVYVCLPPSGIYTHRLACTPHPLAAAMNCNECQGSLYNGRARL